MPSRALPARNPPPRTLPTGLPCALRTHSPPRAIPRRCSFSKLSRAIAANNPSSRPVHRDLHSPRATHPPHPTFPSTHVHSPHATHPPSPRHPLLKALPCSPCAQSFATILGQDSSCPFSTHGRTCKTTVTNNHEGVPFQIFFEKIFKRFVGVVRCRREFACENSLQFRTAT